MARSVRIARRFSLAYVSLAALLGVAVGTFILLVQRPAPKPPPPWSAWQPTETQRSLRQKQIAAHVGSRYHLAAGKKLVNVLARDTAASRLQDVAVAHTLAPTKKSDFISYVDPKKTALYILCGEAQKCSIKSGRAVHCPHDAAPPRGARARALHVPLPGRHRLRHRVSPAQRSRECPLLLEV
jgi:hypothetical protein